MAIGQSINKEGLQVQNYNSIAATLKHPNLVQEFNKSKFETIRQDKVCCKLNKPVRQANATNVGHHALNLDLDLHSQCTKQTSADCRIQFCTDVNFPFNMEKFLKSQFLK